MSDIHQNAAYTLSSLQFDDVYQHNDIKVAEILCSIKYQQDDLLPMQIYILKQSIDDFVG